MATDVTTYAPGTFSWVDLTTPDLDGAARFYEGLFGWTHETMGDAKAPHYTMFFKDGKQVCGMVRLTDDMKSHGCPPNWMSYVSVDNADAVADKAKSLGGQVSLAPMDAMEAGRMAIIVDPTGATFGVWQPKKHQGAQLVNQVGSWCWNELLTSDTAKAEAFYTQLFPWKANTTDNFGMKYTMFELNGKGRSGMMEFKQAPPHWMVYFVVPNYEQAEARAVQLGAKVIMPAKDIPTVGKFGVIQDPQGAYLSIMQMANPS